VATDCSHKNFQVSTKFVDDDKKPQGSTHCTSGSRKFELSFRGLFLINSFNQILELRFNFQHSSDFEDINETSRCI